MPSPARLLTNSGSAAIPGAWTESCHLSFTGHQRPDFDLRQYKVRLRTRFAYPAKGTALTRNNMKLPYDPPTMLSDIVSSLVMLATLLAAWGWLVVRIHAELPSNDGNDKGDAASI